MNNFFLELYKHFQKMGMNGKDLDSMLNALPWKMKETTTDGTVIYTCEIKTKNIEND